MRLNKYDKKMMLNNYDTLLLSIASLVGLIYSFVQTSFSEAKFLLIFPLLIIGWGMPLIGYTIRTLKFKNSSLEKSVIGNFYGWIYLGCGIIMYVFTLAAPTSSENLLTFVTSPSFLLFGSFLVVFMVIISRLGKKFFKLFELKIQDFSGIAVLRAFSAYILAFFTCIVFYLGYAFFLFQVLALSILLIGAAIAFFAANFFISPQIYVPKYFFGSVIIGLILLIISFLFQIFIL